MLAFIVRLPKVFPPVVMAVGDPDVPLVEVREIAEVFAFPNL